MAQLDSFSASSPPPVAAPPKRVADPKQTVAAGLHRFQDDAKDIMRKRSFTHHIEAAICISVFLVSRLGHWDLKRGGLGTLSVEWCSMPISAAPPKLRQSVHVGCPMIYRLCYFDIYDSIRPLVQWLSVGLLVMP